MNPIAAVRDAAGPEVVPPPQPPDTATRTSIRSHGPVGRRLPIAVCAACPGIVRFVPIRDTVSRKPPAVKRAGKRSAGSAAFRAVGAAASFPGPMRGV